MQFLSAVAVLVFFAGLARSQTIVWDGEGGDLLWATGSNWDPDGVPPDLADVQIMAGGVVEGPSLPLVLGAIDCTTGLTVYGAFTVNGQSQITDFTMDGCCAQELRANAPMTIEGSSYFDIQPFMRGASALQIQDEAVFAAGLTSQNSMFDLAGADISLFQMARAEVGSTISGTVTLMPNASIATTGNGTWFLDGGEVQSAAGQAGNSQYSITGRLFSTGGVISGQSGRLDITSAEYDILDNSTIQAEAGATIRLQGGSTRASLDSASFDGSGEILLDTNNTSIDGPIANNMGGSGEGLRIDANVTLNEDLISDGKLTLFGGVEGKGLLVSRGESRSLGFSQNARLVVSDGNFRVAEGTSLLCGDLLFVNGGVFTLERNTTITSGSSGVVALGTGSIVCEGTSSSDVWNVHVPLSAGSATVELQSGVLRLNGPGAQWNGTTFNTVGTARLQVLSNPAVPYSANNVTFNGSGFLDLGGNTNSAQPVIDISGQLVSNLGMNSALTAVHIRGDLIGDGVFVNNGTCALDWTGKTVACSLLNNDLLLIADPPSVSGTIVNDGEVLQDRDVNMADGGIVNNALWHVRQSCITRNQPSGTIQNNGSYTVQPLAAGRIGHTIEPAFNNLGVLIASNADVYVLDAVQYDAQTGRLTGGGWEAINGGWISFNSAVQSLEGSTKLRGNSSSIDELEVSEVSDDAELSAAQGTTTLGDVSVSDNGELRAESGSNVQVDSLSLTNGGTLLVEPGSTTESSGAIDVGEPPAQPSHSVLDEISGVIELSRGPQVAPVIRAANLNLHGYLRPGGVDGAAELQIESVVTSYPSATWSIDVTPNGAADRVLGTGDIHLDGTLEIQFMNSPSIGDSYDIISPVDGTPIGITGTFAAIRSTGLQSHLVPRAAVVGDRVVVTIACRADTNGDGVVTPADFTAWINAFNNNLPACDQNADGSCTPTDFTAWIANFNAGC
ncbi:MAG: hypothetical protein Phyf2KO_27640 [Phycisphaerales bacterium]